MYHNLNKSLIGVVLAISFHMVTPFSTVNASDIGVQQFVLGASLEDARKKAVEAAKRAQEAAAEALKAAEEARKAAEAVKEIEKSIRKD